MSDSPLLNKKFQIVPVHSDSFGKEVIASNAIAHGPLHVIMERIMGSRARADAVQLTARATEKALATLGTLKQREQQLHSREDAISAREDAVLRSMLDEAISKLSTLSRRMDDLERPEPEKIVWPPGTQPDDAGDPAEAPHPTGDLHVIPARHDAPLLLEDPSLGED